MRRPPGSMLPQAFLSIRRCQRDPDCAAALDTKRNDTAQIDKIFSI